VVGTTQHGANVERVMYYGYCGDLLQGNDAEEFYRKSHGTGIESPIQSLGFAE